MIWVALLVLLLFGALAVLLVIAAGFGAGLAGTLHTLSSGLARATRELPPARHGRLAVALALGGLGGSLADALALGQLGAPPVVAAALAPFASALGMALATAVVARR